MSWTATTQSVYSSPRAEPRSRPRHHRSIGVWVVLCLIAPLPLILKLGRSLWDREQYQFFPLMVVGILIVGSERWRDLPWRRARPGSFGVAAIVLSLGLTVLVAGEMLWLRPAAGGALLLILAGLAWRIGGGLLLRAMMPVGLLLATMIPPPGEQELTITLWLQQLAVQASGRLLDGLRVPHVRAGNVLEIPGRRLLLEQACSGINSLTSVLAFVLLWGVWQRRPLWRIALLLPVAAGYVLASNIGRITLEAWLKTRWHIDVLDGTLHEILGVLLFIASVGLTLSFDALIGMIRSLAAHSDAARRTKALTKTNTATGLPPKDFAAPFIGWRDWSLAGFCVLIGVWSQTRVGNAWAPAALGSDARFELPASLVGWKKVTREASIVERPQLDAAKTFLWQFRRGDLIASVALDYPFPSSHELTECYAASGWTLGQRTVQSGQTQVEMQKPAGLEGCLFFESINERGQWEPPPASVQGMGWRGRLELASRHGRGEPSYQVQTLVQSYSHLTDEQLDAMRNLYQAARTSLTTQLLSQLPKRIP